MRQIYDILKHELDNVGQDSAVALCQLSAICDAFGGMQFYLPRGHMNVCPAVMENHVESVNAAYEQDTITRYELKDPNAARGEQEDNLTKPYQVNGQLGYRSEKYNWTYDVQFKAKENQSGHTHYLYLGGVDNKVSALVVLGKKV